MHRRVRKTGGVLVALVATMIGLTLVDRPTGAAGNTLVPSPEGTAPWTGFGYDVAHTSRNADANSVTASNAGSLTQAWEFVTPPPTATGQPNVGFDGSPTLADGMVFVGSDTGIFYALNEDTGTVAWSLDTGFLPDYTCSAAGIRDTATVADDPTTGKPTVYFAGTNGILWAVNGADGTVDWQADIFPPVAARPLHLEFADGQRWSDLHRHCVGL